MSDGSHNFHLKRMDFNAPRPRETPPPSSNDMSEVLKCFKFLAESAPAWLKSLQDLEEKVRQRKAEVEKMSRTPSQTVRKRSGSNESLRPSRDDTGNCPSVVGGGEQQQMSMSSPYAIPVLQRTPSNTSKRKRIASSIASITSATQKRYRARNPIIVYYDSEVQKGFEHLVQGIGSGRNYIRKARLAIRMETLTTVSASARADQAIGTNILPASLSAASRSRSTGRRNDNNNNYNITQSGYEILLAQGLRSTRGLETLRPMLPRSTSTSAAADGLGRSSSTATTTTTTPDPCTLADQALDSAQALCESGAYHFLREGECAAEILGARAIFEGLVESAGKEVERLTVLERARQNRREEERVVEVERREVGRMGVGSNPALIGEGGLGAMIEADDESCDEEGDGEGDFAVLGLPFRCMART
ncbi:hypothetical protein EG328_000314 [Venturia inaequalis]|uniref:Uncharacterized protein n=1 Tax=Venturia inaequalis TaxID=5025 RepID=A0A8H3Z086_VENIN|nr:hypothetical protein EG328_000314 [Venturia inaequalis]